MAKQGVRLSEDTEFMLYALSDAGLNMTQVGKIIRVNRSTVKSYLWMLENNEYVTSAYGDHLAKKRGFKDKSDYLTKKGLTSGRHRDEQARNRGDENHFVYQGRLLGEKGFSNVRGYIASIEKSNQRKPENQALSEIITERLRVLGRGIEWLGDQIGVNCGTISRYRNGKTMPRPDRLKHIFGALGVPFETLDDLMCAQQELGDT